MIKRRKGFAFPEFKIGKLRILTLLMAAFVLICLSGQPAFALINTVNDTGNTDEDTVLNVFIPGVLGNDTGDGMLSVTTPSPFSTAKGANVIINATGDYSYDPNGQFEFLGVGESDTDSFTYDAVDSFDGSTGTATVTITINGANDAPTANDDSGAGFATDEDSSFTTGNVDTDSDASDVLSVQSIDTTGTQGLVADLGNGTFTYDPNGQFESLGVGESTTDTFTYTLSDGNGGTDTATVTITDDAGAIDEENVLSVAAPGVLSNDSDADAGDSFTATAFDALSAQGAVVVVKADGSYTYDPTGAAALQALAQGATAFDTFTYTITDTQGGTDTATVTITVTGVNDAPDANDSDVDDTFTVSSFDALSVQGATVVVNADGSYTYDPTGAATLQALVQGATAFDTFTYTITDTQGGTDTATVTITVTGVNDAPDASHGDHHGDRGE
jgi:VCBS repeat-containing protein